MKKWLMVAVIVIIISIAGYFIYENATRKQENIDNQNYQENNNQNNQEDNNQNKPKENKVYGYKLEENGNITFYKNNEVINEFDCSKGDCEVDLFNYDTEYEDDTKKTYIVGNKVLIAQCDGKNCDLIDDFGGLYFGFKDDDSKQGYGNILIYDIPSGKYQKHEKVVSVDLGDDIKVLHLLNKEIKLIDAEGKVNRNAKESTFKYSCYEGCFLVDYNYKKNIIVFKENKKYGIQELDTGKVLLKAKYDDITILSDNYYAAKTNNKENLYKIDDYTAITKKGYDKIFFTNDDLLIVYNNKELSFINLKEEKIIEETIHIENLLPLPPEIMDGVNVYIDEKNNDLCIIEISDGIEVENAVYSDYTFNLKTHELKKVED